MRPPVGRLGSNQLVASSGDDGGRNYLLQLDTRLPLQRSFPEGDLSTDFLRPEFGWDSRDIST